jgi:methionine synthase I (cobalamin-dependent)
MAGKVAALVAAGASIIGGCCGTTPAHIAAMARAVQAVRQTGK